MCKLSISNKKCINFSTQKNVSKHSIHLQLQELTLLTMKQLEDSFTNLSEKKVERRTVLAFVAIGFLVDIFFYANLSSSQDILQGTVIPTCFVFLSSTGPACLASALYPYFFQKIPVPMASCVIFVVSIAGMLITSIIQEPKLKLIGVCLVSFGYGSLETIFYPLSVFYGKATVDSYTIGAGIATFVAPSMYLGKLLIMQSSLKGVELYLRD